MTKAECMVDGPSWTRSPELDREMFKHDGTSYTTRFYVHETGATLECDNYYGDSWLDDGKRRRNIERDYDSDPQFLELTKDSSYR